MNILNDPSMKEIIVDFCDEADALYLQLNQILEEVEESPLEAKKLEQFGQIIDRIMGAAKSIGATEIATFCELGKVIGYKSSQVKDTPLIEVVVAILFDCIEMLKKMTQSLRVGDEKNSLKLNAKALVSRLHWLSDKFKDIERSSCAIEGNLDQNSIDELMKNLGF